MTLVPDQLVNGKYRVVRLIGDGGMGSVYEVRHEVLGTRVALKFLHPELTQTPGLEQRFLQEARLSATFDNPHIVRVVDVDKAPEGAFLVMELLQGEPLQRMLDRETRLDSERAVAFTIQILQGLEVAHALGVVHRDLKPDNVFVTQSSQGPLLKLLDFGIAKLRATEAYQMTLTRPGAVMGTPEYMAPEQAYSADLVDQRSDLYSVGVMLFEMLSGRRPIEGGGPQQIAERAIRGDVLRLEALCPSLPQTLLEVVNRAIRANPDERWPDAVSMKQALLPFGLVGVQPTVQERAQGFATGLATPFVPVTKTPRVEASWAPPGSNAHSELEPSGRDVEISWAPDPASRLSSVPKTLPPEMGPPLALTQEAKAKTTSMPEVAAMNFAAPPTTAPGPVLAAPTRVATRRRGRALGWVLLLLLASSAAGIVGYFQYVLPRDVGPAPPQPTRREVPAPAPVVTANDFDEDDDYDSTTPVPPRPVPPRPSAPAVPRPAEPVPTLPTFQLPTNLPIPTAIPTELPNLPFPFPVPAPAPTPPPPAEVAPAPGPSQ